MLPVQAPELFEFLRAMLRVPIKGGIWLHGGRLGHHERLHRGPYSILNTHLRPS